eukprot:GGOE01009587.1.p1 GENE.GGOE01009587.1~~GGOE01009587.1.p1  ORF type:complete len:818 (+),score=194.66 GGOE01009587.1:363-2456(+)
MGPPMYPNDPDDPNFVSYHDQVYIEALASSTEEVPLYAYHRMPEVTPSAHLQQQVGHAMQLLVLRNLATQRNSEERAELRVILENILRKGLRDSSLTVFVFGSSALGIVAQVGDVDFYVEMDAMRNGRVTRHQVQDHLQRIYEVLSTCDHRWIPSHALKRVFTARVPIIKKTGTPGLDFDISLFPCGLRNSALLRRYVERNLGILQPLAMTVVQWSKSVGINDSRNGFLTTYSVILMVIFYLICSQNVTHVPIDTIRSKDDIDPEPFVPQPEDPDEGIQRRLGRLLAEFFTFYDAFNFDEDCICIRTTNHVSREAKGWTSRDVPIAIEDPYETHLNTCRNVKLDRFEFIRKQLQLACAALKNGWDAFVRLQEEQEVLRVRDHLYDGTTISPALTPSLAPALAPPLDLHAESDLRFRLSGATPERMDSRCTSFAGHQNGSIDPAMLDPCIVDFKSSPPIDPDINQVAHMAPESVSNNSWNSSMADMLSQRLPKQGSALRGNSKVMGWDSVPVDSGGGGAVRTTSERPIQTPDRARASRADDRGSTPKHRQEGSNSSSGSEDIDPNGDFYPTLAQMLSTAHGKTLNGRGGPRVSGPGPEYANLFLDVFRQCQDRRRRQLETSTPEEQREMRNGTETSSGSRILPGSRGKSSQYPPNGFLYKKSSFVDQPYMALEPKGPPRSSPPWGRARILETLPLHTL